MLGLIGKKVGMTQMFNDDGRLVPVTVLKVEPNIVVGQRTPDRDGYSAVVLAAEDAKPQRVTKPVKGQYEKAGVAPKRRMVEVRDFDQECSIGDSLDVSLFDEVGFVDVSGVSKGKGFQGVMRRHGFSGGEVTHGSKFHRTPGATGMAASPSRTIRGTKMPGRMGGRSATVQNLRIMSVDSENQMLIIRGSVPGTPDGYLLVSKAKKKG
jgi:large subunit ribosomal protein L3